MAEPQAGNHADLYEIEERIDEIVSQHSGAGIAVDGLFCDLDAGFDGKELRSALISHGMIPNVCPNSGNGGESTKEWLSDEQMYRRDGKSSGQPHGLMASKPFSQGLTQPCQVGRDGTSLPLSLFSLKKFTNQISLNNDFNISSNF